MKHFRSAPRDEAKMFHVEHFSKFGSGYRRYGFHLAGGMDIGNQFPGTFGYTDAAGSTFAVVNGGHVVLYGDGLGGTVSFAETAADAADRTAGLGNGTLIVVAAGDHDIHGIGNVSDDMAGAGLGALHTVGTFVLIHLSHAVGVDMNGVKLAGPDAGSPAQTAGGALQGAVAGHLHGGYAVLNAYVAFKLPAGPVAAGTADEGNPALLGFDFHPHDGSNAAGLKARAAGAGVDGSFPGQDGRRAPGAAGIAAAPAVGPRQAVQNQIQLGVGLDLKYLGSQGKNETKDPAQDAKNQYSIEDIHIPTSLPADSEKQPGRWKCICGEQAPGFTRESEGRKSP